MITTGSEVSPISLARLRLKRVIDGQTLQRAYGVEDTYEPLGDELRADLRAVLANTTPDKEPTDG